jgi:stage II sporulation protein E
VHIGPLDDRRELVVISDGMGVGDTAAGESRRAVAAVVRLLRGGIPPERAALLANQLLLAQGSAERYATLDLCVIDKVRMEATWVKMAACDSYLLREHDCSVISGGQLPMGIVAEATPQVTTHHLRSGDVIVMGTDGAMEGLDPDTARRCLVARRRTEATQLAVHMRSAGQARRVHADDQTLAVICISQREKKRAAGI